VCLRIGRLDQGRCRQLGKRLVVPPQLQQRLGQRAMAGA
jgi:hypothetical protein